MNVSTACMSLHHICGWYPGKPEKGPVLTTKKKALTLFEAVV